MTMRFRVSELAVLSGVMAVLVFFYLAGLSVGAQTSEEDTLSEEGAGVAYGFDVDQRINQLEESCRQTLHMLGQAEVSYASKFSERNFAFLHELIGSGFLEPNISGRTLTADYSIAFYLPANRRGFTLLAEPVNIELRPFLFDENFQVTYLTTSIDGDPSDDWTSIRERQTDYFWDNGRFREFNPIDMAGHDSPLQVRLNREKTSYIIIRMRSNDFFGQIPDDSLLYSYTFRSYLIGDLREEF